MEVDFELGLEGCIVFIWEGMCGGGKDENSREREQHELKQSGRMEVEAEHALLGTSSGKK